MEPDRDFKTNPQHWVIIINFLESSPFLIRNKFKNRDGDYADQRKLWDLLAQRLNALGYGSKSVEKWQLAVGRWKSKVKAKASSLRMERIQTGGGPKKTPPLTEIEERLLALMGKRTIVGDSNRELGVEMLQNTERNINNETLKVFAPNTERNINNETLKVFAPASPCPQMETTPNPILVMEPIPGPSGLQNTIDGGPSNSPPPLRLLQEEPNMVKEPLKKTSAKKPRRTDATRRFVTMTSMHSDNMRVLNSIDNNLSSLNVTLGKIGEQFTRYMDYLINSKNNENESD